MTKTTYYTLELNAGGTIAEGATIHTTADLDSEMEILNQDGFEIVSWQTGWFGDCWKISFSHPEKWADKYEESDLGCYAVVDGIECSVSERRAGEWWLTPTSEIMIPVYEDE